MKGSVWADTAHARNFLDCVKSRGKCNADILTGHLSTSATLIGNIALKTESMLKWDAARGALHQQRGGQPLAALPVPGTVQAGLGEVASQSCRMTLEAGRPPAERSP